MKLVIHTIIPEKPAVIAEPAVEAKIEQCEMEIHPDCQAAAEALINVVTKHCVVEGKSLTRVGVKIKGLDGEVTVNPYFK